MDLPLGAMVAETDPAPRLQRRELTGSLVRLRQPLPARDASDLYPSTHGEDRLEGVWTYLGYGPFTDERAMESWIESCLESADPLWYTVADHDDRPVGMAAMMNADPTMRRLELGHIWYTRDSHRTGINTEAAYLMLEEAFTTFRSRRVEWKCDSLNEASRRAAARLGFAFEGVFRNHMIVKGRNRDTAWYAMTDDDWPRVRTVLGEWLAQADPKPSLSGMMG
jgi:RimJ/RimL family protein N-acetyltransferase